MNTIFILDNEKLGTWYVGKIYTKINISGFPKYRTLTQDQLNDNLYKKYIDYENPYINLIFLMMPGIYLLIISSLLFEFGFPNFKISSLQVLY